MPATAPLHRSTAGRRSGALILLTTIIASAMVFIDSTVVNVALPALQRAFDAPVASLQWVVESYLLALTALLLAGGALGDRLGRKRVFLAGVLIFAIASAACGLAQTVTQLTMARVAQGLGGALLVPGSLAIITAAFDEDSRGRAIGTWSAVSAITTSMAPLLGGFLVDVAGWRWIFFINLPLALVVLVVGLSALPESRDEDSPRRADWAGTVLGSAALVALVGGLIESQRLGLGHPLVWGGMTAGALGLVGFAWLQTRIDSPMMPPALFRHRAFVGANAITVAVYAALGTAMFFLPLHLVEVRGYSALQAGAALLPFGLSIGVLSRFTGGLVDRYGARLPLTLGPAVAGGGLALLAVPGLQGGYWTGYFPGVFLFGIGMGLTVAPVTTAVMNAAPANRSGIASGINNALSRVAFLVGIAAIGAAVVGRFEAMVMEAARALDLPDDARQALRAEVLKLGGAQPPSGLAPEAAAALRAAIEAAALSAFRLAMLCCAACALAGAVLARITHDRRST